MPTEKKIRVTLDLKPELYARLEALEKLVGEETKAEVIREALKLYAFVAKRVVARSSFSITQNGEQRELSFFTLPEPAEH